MAVLSSGLALVRVSVPHANDEDWISAGLSHVLGPLTIAAGENWVSAVW